MEFEYSAEHEDFRAILRGFLDRQIDLTTLPITVEQTATARSAWDSSVKSLGLPGLEIPEDFGGSEADLLTVTVAMTELGRAMVPGPLAPTVGLSVPLLLALPASEQRTALLAGVAEGRCIPGAALELFTATARPQVVGRGEGIRVQVSGVAPRVIAGDDATDLLMAADLGGEVAVVHLEATATGVTRRNLDSLDHARGETEVRVEAAEATVLATGTDAVAAIHYAQRRALLFAACESVGGAERTLEIAVKYAKEREAFGKKIGSFQALKHRMASQYVELEMARTVLMYAAWSMTAEAGQSDPTALEQAKLIACETYLETARVSLGILGGIGFTWEHPMHLFFKRASALVNLFSRPESLQVAIAHATLAEHQGENVQSRLVRPAGGVA